MNLYYWFCLDCNSDNYIDWDAHKHYTTPYCCQCGQDHREKYKFIGAIKVVITDFKKGGKL